MKIVHVYDGHERLFEGKGSLPRIVWNIARRTADRGHDVAVVERQWNGLDRKATEDGVRFNRLPLSTASNEPWDEVPYEMVHEVDGVARLLCDRANFALQTARLLRNSEFDIVHVYLPFAANVLVTLAPWWRDRMVYTAQLGELRLDALSETDGETPDVPNVLRRFSPDIYLAKRTGHTTVLNENVRRIFAENGVPEENLSHVPNGVSISEFGSVTADEIERVRERFDLHDVRTMFYAGTIMPRKGVAELVKATDALVNQHGLEDVKLVLAGEPELDEAYLNRVRSLVASGGLEEKVEFPGYLRDETLVPLYAASDVFVLPSFEEGFGMVVSEAMATGTPVIGSDISGVAQQIRDDETGVLVEAGNVAELATALADVLENREKRQKMGERSRQHAQQFSWETVADQYLEVYRELP